MDKSHPHELARTHAQGIVRVNAVVVHFACRFMNGILVTDRHY